MATHSSILAWEIARTEVPDGLPSMGSHRVGYTEQLPLSLGFCINSFHYSSLGSSLLAQSVKNLPAMQVLSLGWEDLEEGIATHSSILAWQAADHGVTRIRHDLVNKSQHSSLTNLLLHLEWDLNLTDTSFSRRTVSFKNTDTYLEYPKSNYLNTVDRLQSYISLILRIISFRCRY